MRDAEPVTVPNDTEVEHCDERTVHYMKMSSRHPSLFIRYGEDHWCARVGTEEVPITEERTLWQLEWLFQHRD